MLVGRDRVGPPIDPRGRGSALERCGAGRSEALRLLLGERSASFRGRLGWCRPLRISPAAASRAAWALLGEAVGPSFHSGPRRGVLVRLRAGIGDGRSAVAGSFAGVRAGCTAAGLRRALSPSLKLLHSSLLSRGRWSGFDRNQPSRREWRRVDLVLKISASRKGHDARFVDAIDAWSGFTRAFLAARCSPAEAAWQLSPNEKCESR